MSVPFHRRRLFGTFTVCDLALCAVLAVPMALTYRLVLVPTIANSTFVRDLKRRGFVESVGDVGKWIGIDLLGRDSASFLGSFGKKVGSLASRWVGGGHLHDNPLVMATLTRSDRRELADRGVAHGRGAVPRWFLNHRPRGHRSWVSINTAVHGAAPDVLVRPRRSNL